jgi:hypothetical protein
MGLSLLVDEPVAKPDDRFDLVGGGAEFSAQAADVHIDRTRLDDVFVSPHAFEEPVARQHAVPVLHQLAKQLEFTPRQLDGSLIDQD